MIIVNVKNYKTGKELLELAIVIEQNDLHTVMAVPAADIGYLRHNTTLNVYAQHTDYIAGPKSTGFLSAQSLKTHGASGTILNHSEHKLHFDVLKKTIEQCKKAKLVTVVCVDSISEAIKVAELKPAFMAFEDPKLIGTKKSAATYASQDISKFAALVLKKSIVPLCGAGISSALDVKKAYSLGCKGVLISSAIADVNVKKAGLLVESIRKLPMLSN